MVNDDAERLLELGDTCYGWASGYKIGAELREIAARLQDRDKARFSASEEKITRDLMAERDSLTARMQAEAEHNAAMTAAQIAAFEGKHSLLTARIKELEGNLYEAETQAAREAFNLRAERDTLRRENEQIAARVKELELEVSAAADECTEYEMQLAESQAEALNAARIIGALEQLTRDEHTRLIAAQAEIERLKARLSGTLAHFDSMFYLQMQSMLMLIERDHELKMENRRLKGELEQAKVDRERHIEVLALFLNSTPGVLDDSDREWAREQIAARAVVKGPGA